MKIARDIEALDKVWEIWEGNSGLFTNWKNVGIPNQGVIYQRRRLKTVFALLLEARNPSIYPGNISTRNRLYITHLSVVI